MPQTRASTAATASNNTHEALTKQSNGVPAKNRTTSGRVVAIVFIALICDLLAFTMPLPLFPRLINDFVSKEAATGSITPTLLSQTLHVVRTIRTTLFSYSRFASTAPGLSIEADPRWDLTLLGGLLASLFSICQFIVSPHLGQLSDQYGRRKVLLATMVGNLLSAVLWLFAGTFGIYAASRVIGGLSEGNVQITIAIISDVTTPETRSKSLALVGVAFSLAFTLGPSAGAYFASRTLGRFSRVTIAGHVLELNGYAFPALITVLLLTIETVFLLFLLPETRWWKAEDVKEAEKESSLLKNGGGGINGSTEVGRTTTERKERLKELQWLHLGFLFFFSGAEFTLTFLTYNLFNYTNAQNGKLLGFIGILSSLLQGGYVRRLAHTVNGPQKLARSGMLVCTASLLLITLLPLQVDAGVSQKTAIYTLYAASAGLAYVSATVVNSLNSLASLECSTSSEVGAAKAAGGGGGEQIEKGKALGLFRSRGQLGRALGPLVATVIYWTLGPSFAYGMGMLGCGAMSFKMSRLGKNKRLPPQIKKGRKDL